MVAIVNYRLGLLHEWRPIFKGFGLTG